MGQLQAIPVRSEDRAAYPARISPSKAKQTYSSMTFAYKTRFGSRAHGFSGLLIEVYPILRKFPATYISRKQRSVPQQRTRRLQLPHLDSLEKTFQNKAHYDKPGFSLITGSYNRSRLKAGICANMPVIFLQVV